MPVRSLLWPALCVQPCRRTESHECHTIWLASILLLPSMKVCTLPQQAVATAEQV